MRLGLTRMSCAAVLLFAISACGPGGGEGSVSGNNPGGGSSSAVEIKFFAANDGTNRMELWKTDGSAAGTQLQKDICPGACSGTTGS